MLMWSCIISIWQQQTVHLESTNNDIGAQLLGYNNNDIGAQLLGYNKQRHWCAAPRIQQTTTLVRSS